MQEATAESVLGNFSDASFTKDGIRTRFFQRDGKYWIHTDGEDGRPADFEVKYTFGVEPRNGMGRIDVAKPRSPAIAVLQAAIKEQPRSENSQTAVLHHSLGLALTRERRYDEAISEFKAGDEASALRYCERLQSTQSR